VGGSKVGADYLALDFLVPVEHLILVVVVDRVQEWLEGMELLMDLALVAHPPPLPQVEQEKLALL
jgi:hypothetical protein